MKRFDELRNKAQVETITCRLTPYENAFRKKEK
jgi:hypothetical protein